MKKLSSGLLICLVAALSAACLARPASGNTALEIFVSPSGSDKADGSAKNPFKTIERAKELLDAKAKSGFEGAVTVNVGKGLYPLEGPLVFGSEYSGGKMKVVFRGEKGAVLSGGRRVTVWRNEGGNLWSADVRAGWKPFRNFYGNGKRLVRSRHPNSPGLMNIARTDGKKITLRTAVPAPIGPEEKAELVVLENWTVSRTQIEHGEATGTTTLHLTDLAGYTDHAMLVPKAGMGCFVENAKAFLDTPGEWYLDDGARKLFYLSADGEDPNDGTFVAPVLDKLVMISGTEATPVGDITFEGISFQHTGDFRAWRKYSGMQAGYHTLDKNAPIFDDGAAIELTFARNVTFRRCAVSHTEGAGIGIGKGSSGTRIEECHLYDIGGNGIHIGHRTDPLKSLDQDWDSDAYVPRDNRVTSSFVETCGQENYGSVGIFTAFSQKTVVSGNTVAHMPYTGVSFGFRWNPTETSMKNNTIEYNHIYDVMKTLADGGGIYTLGLQTGTTIRKNLIHDIRRSRHAYGGAANNGIFFDEGTTAIFVDENIIHGLARNALSTADPIRFNQTKADNLRWGTNFFDVRKGKTGFPNELEKEILDATADSLEAREIE